MKLKTIVCGQMQENCYLIFDENTKKGLIIDPGDEAKKISKGIEVLGMQPLAILITHGHFDHIMAADDLRDIYDIPVYISGTDYEMAKDAEKNLVHSFIDRDACLTADQTVEDGDELTLTCRIQVLSTPGHTPGGLCYYLPDEGIVFAGDTLFRESIGRTDMGGSMEQLLKGVREKLFVLPDETKVYPGHGFPTTIGHEKTFNPFFGR